MAKKYYECFSSRLHEFLLKEGHMPVQSYIHNRTGVKCNVYRMTDDLSKSLYKWKDTNPNK